MDTRLSACIEFGQKVPELRGKAAIAEAAAETAGRSLPADEIVVYLWQEATDTLRPAAWLRKDGEGAGASQAPEANRWLQEQVAQRGRTHLVADARADKHAQEAFPGAGSLLFVPLCLGEKVMGVLGLAANRPDAFGEGDRQVASLIACQLALALDNDERRSWQGRAAAALQEVTCCLGTSLDLQATLKATVEAAAALIPCALAEVSLWDEESQLLTVSAFRGEEGRAAPIGHAFPAKAGYTGWLVRHRRPLYVADVDARQDIRPHLLPGEKPFRSFAGVPLMVGDQLLGTLVLVGDEPGVFPPGEMRLLELVASQAAAAMRNAQLYRNLEQRARQLEAVQKVAEIVNRPGPLPEILAEGLAQATAVLGLEMGILCLPGAGDGGRELFCHQGLDEGQLAQCQERMRSHWPAEWPQEVAVQVTPLPPHQKSHPAWWQEAGLRMIADLPLFADDQDRASAQPVGMLSLATREPKSFDEADLVLLRAIGDQLGAAISNARLRAEALEAERLAAIGQVAASVAHDLRSPLGGILRSAEFLARPEISTETREKLGQAVISLTRRLINTSQEILDYVRGEPLSLQETCLSCLLSTFLDEVLTVLEVDFSDRGIEVIREFRYPGKVLVDADRMAQVVYNIASNARDAMPDGGSLSVSTEQVGDRVHIRFADSGSGVPAELGDKVFEPFFSYGKRQGAGLGLSIARRIVEEHGGELLLESANGVGATLLIVLPVVG